MRESKVKAETTEADLNRLIKDLCPAAEAQENGCDPTPQHKGEILAARGLPYTQLCYGR